MTAAELRAAYVFAVVLVGSGIAGGLAIAVLLAGRTLEATIVAWVGGVTWALWAPVAWRRIRRATRG